MVPGLIQAANVKSAVVVKVGTETEPLVPPVSARASKLLPLVVQRVELERVPMCPLPVESEAVVPVPSSNFQ